jgi:hypothetical protein
MELHKASKTLLLPVNFNLFTQEFKAWEKNLTESIKTLEIDFWMSSKLAKMNKQKLIEKLKLLD